MVYMTMIARVADGLPLAASIQEDEQVFEIQSRLISAESLLCLVETILYCLICNTFLFILDGKEYCRLSTTGKEIIQNINNNKSYQMFNRIRAISIPVSFHNQLFSAGLYLM